MLNATVKRVSRTSCLVYMLTSRASHLIARNWVVLLALVSIFMMWEEIYFICLRMQMKSLNEFQYPAHGDLYHWVELHNQNRLNGAPINRLDYQLVNWDNRIDTQSSLVNVVKTSHDNLANRQAIRQTWANRNCSFNREANIQTLFIIGQSLSDNSQLIEAQLEQEAAQYHDIVRYNLVDSYYNNTYKFMVIMDFALKKFPNMKFLIITDDDYFIHPPNLFNHMVTIHKLRYPIYVGGSVWYNAQPIRVTEKWSINLEDYPYSHFPDYPTGGNLIISRPMVELISVAMQHVKFMSFDDVLVGIVLFKLGIAPDNVQGMCKTKMECHQNSVKRVISSHGYRFPEDLLLEWELYRFNRFC